MCIVKEIPQSDAEAPDSRAEQRLKLRLRVDDGPGGQICDNIDLRVGRDTRSEVGYAHCEDNHPESCMPRGMTHAVPFGDRAGVCFFRCAALYGFKMILLLPPLLLLTCAFS